MNYCGIDLASKASAICVIDNSGDVVAEFEVPTDADGFRSGLSRWPGLKCVIEASPLSEWVANELELTGHDAIIIDARKAKAVIQTKKKTDRLDAHNLASHLERSTLNHGYGYGSTADRSSCFARSAGSPDPFIQHAGQ